MTSQQNRFKTYRRSIARRTENAAVAKHCRLAKVVQAFARADISIPNRWGRLLVGEAISEAISELADWQIGVEFFDHDVSPNDLGRLGFQRNRSLGDAKIGCEIDDVAV